MKIVVEGCAHGELDKIYEAIGLLEMQKKIKIDLLIICGDFQSVRNPADLNCMSVSPKHKKLNTFYKYYSGVQKAPVLTIFIGGNHEASNFLSELPYGGWVCPNIYYLGYANVINIGGIRIAGMSGIYNGHDYLKGHFERAPYDSSSKKSVYHVRNLEVFRLKQIKKPIDIFLSHDWPRGVYNYGNKESLLRQKPFFEDEISNNSLGSPPAEELLKKLKPSYWFSAHLHCEFAAVIPHENNTSTKFFALDKCLPCRKFLKLIDIESSTAPFHIEYDTEWLSVLKSTDHLLSVSRINNFMPGKGCSERYDFTPSEIEIECISVLFNGNLKVPCNFSLTASTYDPFKQSSHDTTLKIFANPQTERLCKLLNITDPLLSILNKSNTSLSLCEISGTSLDQSFCTVSSSNPDEMHLNEVENSTTDLNALGCTDFLIDLFGSSSKKTKSYICSTSKPFIDLHINGNTLNNYNCRKSYTAYHMTDQFNLSPSMHSSYHQALPSAICQSENDLTTEFEISTSDSDSLGSKDFIDRMSSSSRQNESYVYGTQKAFRDFSVNGNNTMNNYNRRRSFDNPIAYHMTHEFKPFPNTNSWNQHNMPDKISLNENNLTGKFDTSTKDLDTSGCRNFIIDRTSSISRQNRSYDCSTPKPFRDFPVNGDNAMNNCNHRRSYDSPPAYHFTDKFKPSPNMNSWNQQSLPYEISVSENNLTGKFDTSTDLDISGCNNFITDGTSSSTRQNRSYDCSTPEPLIDLSINGNNIMNNYNRKQSFNSSTSYHMRDKFKPSPNMNSRNHKSISGEIRLGELDSSTTDSDISECKDFFIDRTSLNDQQNRSYDCSTRKPFRDFSVNGNNTMHNYNRKQSLNSPTAYHMTNKIKLFPNMHSGNHQGMPYARNHKIHHRNRHHQIDSL